MDSDPGYLGKVGVFVDISNLYYCVRKYFSGRRVDFLKYLTKARGFDYLYRAYAYGAARVEDEADSFIQRLKEFGYEIKYKEPKEYDNPEYRVDLKPIELIINHYRTCMANDAAEAAKALSVDADRAMEKVTKLIRSRSVVRKADWDVGIAMDIVRLAPRLDKIVIGTADGDLTPVVLWAMDQGCKCVVYAAGMSKELRNTGCECIEIDKATTLEDSYG